ncbi:hypothetical protein [Rickettsia endosymbiont of Halotydeus destructor]|uniref:hypothetical protein n=1 Tax=Rickettsia endosymbiont of Halotydeus destructor TaxID=2996754 RepID=UPI003BB0FD83
MFNLNELLNRQFFTKLLDKLKMHFWYRKNIVILFGNKGIFLSAFIRDKLAESLFVPFSDSIDLNLYKSFFHKFKNFDVFFLLDGPDCKMRHDSIPILKSLVKIDPIERFIDGYFNKDDITAHYIYKISTIPSEIWSTLIMSSPCVPPLSDVVKGVLETRSLNFKGIYFLALEFKAIIDNIIKNTEQNKYTDYFQICVFILEASGIKFIIKYQNNIISTQTFEYPPDKSESYIQGIIEQELTDCLLLYKNYISNLKNEVCIIFIVGNELQILLQQSNFENHPMIFVPVNEILNEPALISGKFLDTNISKLFIKYKKFQAVNANLKTIKKLNFVSSLIFKLFTLGMLILLFIAAIIKYQVLKNNKEVLFFSEKYYATTQNYNEIKRKYPYIQNTTNLADLYVIEKLLEMPVILPFELITKLDSAFKIKEIKWELIDVDNTLLISKRQLGIKILLEFITNNLSLEDSMKNLNNHINDIHNILNQGDIDFIVTISKNSIINISDRIVIPLFIQYKRKG